MLTSLAAELGEGKICMPGSYRQCEPCEWPEGFVLLDSCGHSTGTSLLETLLFSPSGGIVTECIA